MSNTKSFPFWIYIQLKHFLDSPVNRECFTKTPMVLESLCSGPSPQSHLISGLYATMFGEPYASLRSEHAYWETELGTVIDDTAWDRVHLYMHKASLNAQTQENGYKIKMRRYRTLKIIHKFIPVVSDQCWRCEKGLGTLFHIWWTCPLIQPY